MDTEQAVKTAIKNGYTSIDTFMGPLPLVDWLKMTTLKNVTYEPGKLVTPWLPSILEKGKFERLTFILS